jgi:RsiW-degrading membrane proteinase PrsW (M82 family)
VSAAPPTRRSRPTRVDVLASPLRHPPVARAVAFLVTLLLLCATAVLFALVEGLGDEGRHVFVRALLASTALSVPSIAVLAWLDRREREAPALYVAAFLWGGFIATMVALPFNTAALYGVAYWLKGNAALTAALGPDAPLILGAPLAAPLTEELAKGLGIALLFVAMRDEFDNVRDGLVYGALVGAGFNWFESALYVAQNAVQYGVAPYGFQLGARYAWLGLGGHVLFSGLFGAFLGMARATRRPWVRVLAPPAGLCLAMFAHAWNNALPLFAALLRARGGQGAPAESAAPPELDFLTTLVSASASNAVIFLPFVAVVAWLLRTSGDWERRVIREELALEIGAAITSAEYEAVLLDRRWRTRRIVRGNRAAARALVNAQNELAFQKRRVRDRGGDPEADTGVRRWRLVIARARAALDR